MAERTLAALVTGRPDAEVFQMLAPLGADDLRRLVMALRAEVVSQARVCKNPACGKNLRRRADGGWEGGRGLCAACYHRARDAGFPDVVPPAMQPAEVGAAGSAVRRARRAERFQAYCALRSRGVLRHWAAARVGLRAEGTAALRYEREYRVLLRQRKAAA